MRRVVVGGQKEGGPPTPKRPAIAFLVTPKTPAKRGKWKISNTCMFGLKVRVNRNFQDFWAWTRSARKPLLTSGMDDTICHWTMPKARLQVTGEDAATFLQGQFSNDLRRAEPNPATYGLWLNHKGRCLADSHVLQRGPQRFDVISQHTPAAIIRERLESYIIADDVAVADVTSEAAGVLIAGARASAVVGHLLGKPTPEGREFVATGERIALPGRCCEKPSWLLVMPPGDADAVRAELARENVRCVAADAVARRRIAAGIPRVPDDLGPEDLPMEGGLEHDAISFTKGCYLGQEVMARLHNLGQVRRRLFVVQFAAGVTWSGERPALFAGTQKVGELRTVAPAGEADGKGDAIGLAMLQVHAVKPGTTLTVEPAGPGGVTVVALAGWAP